MKESVRRARHKLGKAKLPPRDLAEIAAEASGEETFITACGASTKKPASSPRTSSIHEQVEGLLAQADINIVADGCRAIERDVDRLAEEPVAGVVLLDRLAALGLLTVCGRRRG